MDDARAVELVRGGDTEAFSVLVKRYQNYLFGLLGRHLPESEVAEAAQDSFLLAYEKLSQLREPSSFKSWLTSLALRRAIRFWREVSMRKEVPIELEGSNGQDWLDKLTSEDSLQRHDAANRQREARSVVMWLLGHVKPDDRVALGLYYAGEHELTEIASMLGWSVEKVKVRLHRARKSMARVLEEHSQGG